MSTVKLNGTHAAGLLEEATQPAAARRFYSSGEIRMLVLDDDPAIGRLVQAAFSGHDFEIDVISDPSFADAQLRQRQYQVIILDYVLPGLDSAQVIQCVREQQSDASIIVITAYPSMDSCAAVPTGAHL